MSNRQVIVFWAEGNGEMGYGHLGRIKTLSHELCLKNSIFFSVESESRRFFENDNYRLIDYEELLKLKDFVLVTDLRFPEKYSQKLYEIKKRAKRHLAIIDMGLGQIKADIILDGHLKPYIPYKYMSEIPHYVGPKYFIFSSRYRHFNKAKKKIKKKAKKIFLSLGGGVKVEQLYKFSELLGKEGYVIEVAFGFGKSPRERRWFRKNFPFVKIVGKVQDLSRKYYTADISITAGGISYYESAVVGTPSLYFYKDEFQKFIAKELEKAGLGICVGDINNFDEKQFIETLNALKYDSLKREKISRKAKSTVDGLSIHRIKKILCS